jgi:hypothetical protein
MVKNALVMLSTIAALVLVAVGVDVALREPDGTPTMAATAVPTETPARIETPTRTPTTAAPAPTPAPTAATPVPTPTPTTPPTQATAPETPRPPATPKVEVDWHNHAPEVRTRIDAMGAAKDCAGLQYEFDVAYQMDGPQRNRVGSGNADLMRYIDQWMRMAGCYH